MPLPADNQFSVLDDGMVARPDIDSPSDDSLLDEINQLKIRLDALEGRKLEPVEANVFALGFTSPMDGGVFQDRGIFKSLSIDFGGDGGAAAGEQTDFSLYDDAGTIRMTAGSCAYYMSGSNTWDLQTVATVAISVPPSNYTFLYIRRVVSATDVPTYTVKTITPVANRTTAYTTQAHALSDDDIYWVGWVKSDGTFSNDNVGPWHEKRMA